MKLVNLKLDNFRNYKTAEIDFPEGLTGVIGTNGAGKSTLMEAIAWTLYGNAAARTSKEQIKRQTSSTSEICQAILEFEISNDHYRVVREMRGANFSSDASVHVNKKTAARGIRATLEYITKVLGLDREAFFTSFFAKQKELNALSDLQPAERKNLIIKMLGIDGVDEAIELIKLDMRDVATKIEMLKERVLDENTLKIELESKLKERESSEKRRMETKEEGDNFEINLKNLKSNIEREREKKDEHTHLSQTYSIKQSELENTRENLTKYLDEQKELSNKKVELQKLEKSIAEYEEIKKISEEMLKLKGEQKLVSELMDRKNHLQNELKNLKEKMKEFKNVFEILKNKVDLIEETKLALEKHEKLLEEVKEKLHNSKISLAHIEPEIKRLKKQKEEIEKLGPESKCPTCLRPLEKDFSSIEKQFSNQLAILEEEFLKHKKTILNLEKIQENKFIEVKVLKEKKEIFEKEKNNVELKTKEASHLTQKIEQLKNGLSETERKLEKIGRFVYNEKEHLALKERLGELEKKRNTAFYYEADIKRLPKIEKEIANLKQKEKALNEDVDKIKRAGKNLSFSKDAYQKLQKDFETTQEKHHSIEIKLKDIEHDCKIIDIELEKIKKSLEENKDKREKIKKLSKKRIYLEELKKIFLNFRKHLIGRIRPSLSQKASDLFQALTEGKYSKVELDENYELQVYDNGERFPIERYSGGEKDLANLCLRIAISQVMTEGSEQNFSFIVLDEIFGSQDSLRQENIMRALTKLANQFRQIFIITHVDSIKDSLENVINVWEDEEGISQAQLE